MVKLTNLRLRGNNLTTQYLRLGYSTPAPAPGPSPEPEPIIPGLEGIVGIWNAYGLTNEEMKANPVWKDLSGNGNDIQLKNFGWRLQSGVGMYNQDFLKYGFGNLHQITYTRSSYKIDLEVPASVQENIYSDANSLRPVGYVYDFSVKITGLKEGSILSIGGLGANNHMEITHDGVYSIKTTVEDTWEQKRIYFWINNLKGSQMTLSIEQIPDYPGAICFDGVDDYGINLDFPVFTKEKGYTVMALRNLFYKSGVFNCLVSNKNAWTGSSAFVFDYKPGGDDKVAMSFDWVTYCKKDKPDLVSYQTSIDYNGEEITAGDSIGTDKLLLCLTALSGLVQHSSAALYSLAILDHDSTAEERQLVIDYWKKEYPELFPDQAWTVTGKTNSDADRATIKNITGNGNDLVLTNFGFAENSGYATDGDYEGYLLTDGVDDQITSSQAYILPKDYTIVGDWAFLTNEENSSGIVHMGQLYIYNGLNGLYIYINSTSITNRLDKIKSLKAVCSNGKVYDENWNEIVVSTGDIANKSRLLLIGYRVTHYTSMAFKNLAIYNNTILDKEQCIRAYSWLQQQVAP